VVSLEELTPLLMDKRFEQTRQRAHDPERKINYANDKITVIWKPALCTHSGRCFTGLPAVFNPRVKKWVDVNAASSEKIMEQVKRCPSGALTFFINSEKEAG
jgi:putative redox protein